MLKQFYLLFLIFAIGVNSVTVFNQATYAVNTSDWRAGNIIDDGVFTDTKSMSVDDIQAFLNSKVPVCDSNGIKSTSYYYNASNGYTSFETWQSGSSYVTTSRAVFGSRYSSYTGRPGNIPYTCFKDFYEVPKTEPGPGIPANNYGGAPIPSGAKSSAQLIWDAAQTYNISPRVLLVKLGTESAGPLTSDDWPFLSQYTYAMGAHCPDSGPGGSANCDSDYAGFSIQISEAASLLRWYLDSMSQPWWSYKKPYQNNNILWNIIESKCGGSNVYIDNKATAALYTYTPYQPNQAALNNMYGDGDGCSAYGNRNFWRTFNDWFEPIKTLRSGLSMNIISQPLSNPARGQDVSYTVSYTNNLTYDVTLDAVGVVGRYGDVYTGPNRDFGWLGPVTLKPGIAQQFTFTSTIKDVGTIYAWPAVNYQGKYIHYNNWGTAMNSHQANLNLTTPLSISSTNPVAGQIVTLSATIKNNEAYPIHIDAIGIPIRYYGAYGYDVAWDSSLNTIAPGATQNLSGSTTFDKPGPYSAWVSWNMDGQYTTLSPVNSYNVTSLNPNFTLSYIEMPNSTPAIGEDIVVKFKLKNNLSVPIKIDAVGVVGRYNNPYVGANRDFGWVGPEQFAANEEKSYTTFVSTVSELNNFYAWVAVNYNGNYTHFNNWGFIMTPHKPNLSIATPITTTPDTPIQVGQTVAITTSIKNNEPKPINYNAIGIPIRYYGVYSYDTAWVGPGVLAASGQIGDTLPLTGTVKFDKAGPYSIWASANIKGGYMTIGNQKELNL